MKKFALINEGLDALQAAAARKAEVEVVYALSAAHYELTPSDLVAKPKDWFSGAKGAITGVKAGAGKLMQVAITFPISDAQSLKSFEIFIKPKDRDRAVPLYVESDANSAIRLDHAVVIVVELPINVASSVIKDAGTIPGGEGGDIPEDVVRVDDTGHISADVIPVSVTEAISANATAINELAASALATVEYNSETHVLTLKSNDGSNSQSVDLT